MAELKTKRNADDPRAFIASVTDPKRRTDAEALLEIFEDVTGEPATMWGSSIIGFGSYDYRYESGRTGTWMKTGFSPRKQSMTLYIMPGFDDYGELLSDLGPHTTGKSCLYVKRLDDVDEGALRMLIAASVKAITDSNAD